MTVAEMKQFRSQLLAIHFLSIDSELASQAADSAEWLTQEIERLELRRARREERRAA